MNVAQTLAYITAKQKETLAAHAMNLYAAQLEEERAAISRDPDAMLAAEDEVTQCRELLRSYSKTHAERIADHLDSIARTAIHADELARQVEELAAQLDAAQDDDERRALAEQIEKARQSATAARQSLERLIRHPEDYS